MSQALQALLSQAAQALRICSSSPQLDAELLLSQVLGKDRLFLKTHPEMMVGPVQQKAFEVLLQQRQAGQPIAYLLGHKAFWTFDLLVNQNVLIPRPETECLVEAVLSLCPQTQLSHPVLELGTGSAAIALALAIERPAWKIIAVDKSPEALKIAMQNAERVLGPDQQQIRFFQGSWFEPVKSLAPFAVIVSNPPYLSALDPHLHNPDLQAEPLSALVSGETGLEDLQYLIKAGKPYLADGGYLCLEHGRDQQALLLASLAAAGYLAAQGFQDLAGLPRVVTAQQS